MDTYYDITATIPISRIEASSPQEAAAKAYALIAAQLAEPERILVWEKRAKENGGSTFTSTAWTWDEQPRELVYKKQPAKPAQAEQDVPVPVTADAAAEDAPASQLV